MHLSTFLSISDATVTKKTHRTHSKDSGVYDDYIDPVYDDQSDQGIASDGDTSRRQSVCNN